MIEERSWMAALFAAVAIGLLGVSLVQPWLQYDYSSGRQTPPGGPQDEGDLGVERDHYTVAPFSQSGDATPAQPSTVTKATAQIGWSVVAGMGLLAIMALGEFPGIHNVIRRRVGMALALLGLVTIAVALAEAWFELPAAVGGSEMSQPFAYRLTDDGYVRVTLDWGWALAALAFPAAFAALLAKVQAGSADAAMVEILGAKMPTKTSAQRTLEGRAGDDAAPSAPPEGKA